MSGYEARVTTLRDGNTTTWSATGETEDTARELLERTLETAGRTDTVIDGSYRVDALPTMVGCENGHPLHSDRNPCAPCIDDELAKADR